MSLKFLKQALIGPPERSDLHESRSDTRRLHAPQNQHLSVREPSIPGFIGVVTDIAGFSLLIALVYFSPKIYLASLFIFLVILKVFGADLVRKRGSIAQRVPLVYLLALIPCVLVSLHVLSK